MSAPPATPLIIAVKRVVPGPQVTLHDFLSATDQYDWRLLRRVRAQDGVPEEHILRTPDGQSTIHWIKDRRIGIDYIAIAGERRDEIANQLAAAIAIRSDDEIRRAPIQADSVDARMRAIYHLALTAPDARDETILHWFERYLADPERDLRHAAVIGISYIGWPDFVPPLQALAAHDPDEIVRQDAATLIENLQKHPARSVVPH